MATDTDETESVVTLVSSDDDDNATVDGSSDSEFVNLPSADEQEDAEGRKTSASPRKVSKKPKKSPEHKEKKKKNKKQQNQAVATNGSQNNYDMDQLLSMSSTHDQEQYLAQHGITSKWQQKAILWQVHKQQKQQQSGRSNKSAIDGEEDDNKEEEVPTEEVVVDVDELFAHPQPQLTFDERMREMERHASLLDVGPADQTESATTGKAKLHSYGISNEALGDDVSVHLTAHQLMITHMQNRMRLVDQLGSLHFPSTCAVWNFVPGHETLVKDGKRLLFRPPVFQLPLPAPLSSRSVPQSIIMHTYAGPWKETRVLEIACRSVSSSSPKVLCLQAVDDRFNAGGVTVAHNNNIRGLMLIHPGQQIYEEPRVLYRSDVAHTDVSLPQPTKTLAQRQFIKHDNKYFCVLEDVDAKHHALVQSNLRGYLNVHAPDSLAHRILRAHPGYAPAVTMGTNNRTVYIEIPEQSWAYDALAQHETEYQEALHQATFATEDKTLGLQLVPIASESFTHDGDVPRYRGIEQRHAEDTLHHDSVHQIRQQLSYHNTVVIVELIVRHLPKPAPSSSSTDINSIMEPAHCCKNHARKCMSHVNSGNNV